MTLEGTKCYISLEWVCCLLVATAMSSVIENHTFVRWIFSPRLKETFKNLFFNSLITGRSFGNLSYLRSCSLSQRSKLWRIRSNVSQSDITCTKLSGAFLMALSREKFIQTVNSGYLDYRKFYANPFTILLSGSRKILELHQRFIDARQDSRSPRNPFNSRSFRRWIFVHTLKSILKTMDIMTK